MKKKAAEWRAANPEKHKALLSEWGSNNKDRRKKVMREWQLNNPERVKMHSQNRRARKLSVGGKLSSDLAERLFVLQRGLCACCGLPLGDDYHMDHIMPLALGGSNEDSNIQLLRAFCNHSKRAKHPIEYMRSKGYLL